MCVFTSIFWQSIPNVVYSKFVLQAEIHSELNRACSHWICRPFRNSEEGLEKTLLFIFFTVITESIIAEHCTA